MSAAQSELAPRSALKQDHSPPQSYVTAITCLLIPTFATASTHCGKAFALLLAEKEVKDDYTTNDAGI
jgi:hypothetical protein